MANVTKKSLKYSSFEELQKNCAFNFRNLDFNKPSICNSLLKLHDQGNKYLLENDDELAYMMLMRFFEGVVNLRRSNLYKQDHKYVDDLITHQKLEKTLVLLEDLKKQLRERYPKKTNDQNISEQKTSVATYELVSVDELAQTENGMSKIQVNSVSKRYLNAKELVDLICKATYKLLLIDTRTRKEFEFSHMYLNIPLADEKSRSLVSYINIPDELIETTSWNIHESLKKWEKSNQINETSMIVSKVFATRNEFDYLILFDRESKYAELKPESKISILKRAVYDYDTEKCKNEPLVLDGGWNQWVLFYPCYVTNLNPMTVFDQNILNQKKPLKLFDFDYPELVKPAPQPTEQPQTPKIDQGQDKNKLVIDLNANSNVNGVMKSNDSASSPAVDSQNVPQSNNNNSKPSVNRSNKPNFIPTNSGLTPVSTLVPIPSRVFKDSDETNNSSSDRTDDSNNKPPNNKVVIPVVNPSSNARRESDSADSESSDEGPVVKLASQNSASTQSNYRTKPNNINETIFNSVYAPNRNRKFQTPYMQEGAAKVLNPQTGLFSYNPPTGAPNEQSKLSFKPPAKGGEPVTKKPLPTKPAKQVSFASNLKRTLSSPNIAKLEDEDEALADEKAPNLEEEKRFIKQEQTPNVSVKPAPQPPRVVASEKPAPKPNVNRNSKPLPDSVMRSRIDELQPVFGNVHPGLTGIRNLGNTCFMNSILQCLSNSERLVRYFLSNQHRNDLNRTNELGFKGEIADEFSVIIQSIWGGHCKIISPRRFKFIIGQFNQQFVSNEQQDAQELLLFLLDGLHEDLNRVTVRPKIVHKEDQRENMPDHDAANLAWNIHQSINNSIIVDLFQGQFKSTVNCLYCNKKSIKFDAFMYLTLPLPNVRCDIYTCLNMFLNPERMSGESKWKCPQCREYRDAEKKIDIWKLPPLLIVHLKRFKYQGVWRDKISTHVDYPINLNLDKYLHGDARVKSNNSNNYRLYAISNHSGTLDGGHYTSMCRNFQMDRWFKYDDTHVKEITNPESLISPQAYILFYARQ